MRLLDVDSFGNRQYVGADSDGNMVLKTEYADTKAILDQNARMRSAGHGNGKEWKLAASIPLSLIMKWKIEHGVDAFSNDPAHKKKFRALLNDHQYKLLRVWEGHV